MFRNKSTRFLSSVLAGVALYAVFTSLPDIKRYIRISMM
jgi:hypothetical protein